MKDESLYSLAKDRLQNPRAVLSDNETLLLNRRDSLLAEVSDLPFFLSNLNLKGLSFSDRYFYNNINLACKLINTGKPESAVLLADPAMSCELFYTYIKLNNIKKCYIPRGIVKMSRAKGLVERYQKDLTTCIQQSGDYDPVHIEHGTVIILTSTKNDGNVNYAVDRFMQAKRAILLIKDFSRSNVKDGREYLADKNIEVISSLEGHGWAMK